MKANPKSEEFKAKYPLLFREGCLRSGFHLPAGWYPLVERLCSSIENQLTHFVPEEIRGEVYVVQVKEKFGGLRFYMNVGTPYIDGAISLAESLSYITCEECGNSGELRKNGYLRVLCNKDYAISKEQIKESNKKYLEEQKERTKQKKLQRLLEESLKK